MKNLFIFILLISGSVLIYLGINNYSTPTSSSSIHYSTVFQPNAFQMLKKNIPGYMSSGSAYRAVFFIYTKNCGNCYAEVNDYLGLIQDEKINDISISSIGILHNEDKAIAELMAKITDLPFDQIFGIKPDKRFQEELLMFNSELVLNQLVLINESGDLFFRIFLPSGEVTPMEQKKRVLALAINQNE